MTRLILAPIALAGVFAACGRGAGEGAQRADSYQVYAAALQAFATNASQPIRIASRTWPYALDRALDDTSFLYLAVRNDSSVGPDLLRAYDRANHATSVVCDCFPSGQKVELVTAAMPRDVAGPIALSAVGFDARRTRALVALTQSCGPHCGSSVLYLVVRRDGGWYVSRRLLTGAS